MLLLKLVPIPVLIRALTQAHSSKWSCWLIANWCLTKNHYTMISPHEITLSVSSWIRTQNYLYFLFPRRCLTLNLYRQMETSPIIQWWDWKSIYMREGTVLFPEEINTHWQQCDMVVDINSSTCGAFHSLQYHCQCGIFSNSQSWHAGHLSLPLHYLFDCLTLKQVGASTKLSSNQMQTNASTAAPTS